MMHKAMIMKLTRVDREALDQVTTYSTGILARQRRQAIPDEDVQRHRFRNALADEIGPHQPSSAALLTVGYRLGRIKPPTTQSDKILILAANFGSTEKCSS